VTSGLVSVEGEEILCGVLVPTVRVAISHRVISLVFCSSRISTVLSLVRVIISKFWAKKIGNQIR